MFNKNTALLFAIAAIAVVIYPFESQAQTRGQRYCKKYAGWNGTFERMCNAPHVGTGDLIDNGLFFNRRKPTNTPSIRVRRCTTVGYRADGTPVIKCKK